MAFTRSVPIELSRPHIDELGGLVRVLREWQREGTSVQLHPGDLGWYWRLGPERLAAALRSWSREGRVLALGLLDGPALLRLAVAPEAELDGELARQMVADVTVPERDVLPPGEVDVEVRFGGPFRAGLLEAGWGLGEPWTPLRRSLAEPVEDCGARIELVGPARAQIWVDVQRAAFEGSTMTLAHWFAMAAGSPYADARCLVVYDRRDIPAGAVTVWSAGPGRPGLLEPMGVHREHRRRGYGTAITRAAASFLRELGSSSATVCTSSSNRGGVATYRAAGFQPLPEVQDLHRPA